MGTRLRLSEAENLAETLDVGNFTTNGQQIEALNGGGILDLRGFTTDNVVILGNSKTFDSRGFYFTDNTQSAIGFFDGGAAWQAVTTEDGFFVYHGNVKNGFFAVNYEGFSFFKNSVFVGSNLSLVVFENDIDRAISNQPNSGAIINSGTALFISTYKQSVERSVIIAGKGLTAKTNDTLYTNQISLQESTVLFDTILKASTATADRTATLQDSSGTIAYLSDIASSSNGLYAQTVNSATSTTAPEQSIVGTGVGSLTVPPNSFIVGDSYHAKIGGIINATGGGGRSEIIIRIKTGATILATTGVFDLDTATSQGWECEIDFTIATIGAGGTICTNGNFAYVKDGDRKVSGYVFQDLQPINTTISNTLDITAEWQVINAGDSIYSANFVLYKVY